MSDSEFLEGRAIALVVTTPAGLEGKGRQELRHLIPDARVKSLFLKGNLMLLSDLPEQEALKLIADADTRYLAQVAAVQRSAVLKPDPGHFSDVVAAATDLGRLRSGQTFVVRCRRRGMHQWSGGELERAVAAELERATGAVGDYEAATDWHVTVQVYQDIAYVGVNRPADLIQKTPRQQRKYAPGQRPLNRAQWKIREAISAFRIELPEEACVLDLGSAPGGWAAVLAESAARVVAVDPADLDPSVTALPNVEHLRCRAEALSDRTDLVGKFDLLTCDMNLDPAESAGILCRLAGLLRPGAQAVMTVKYVTRQRRRHEREAREILSGEYQDIRFRHLPHNALETTIAMRRKGADISTTN